MRESTKTQAVDWAVNTQKVDVISIFWGFDDIKPKIEKALKEGDARDVVILGAAANHGRRASIAFPANFKNCVVCIGAANGDGVRSSYTADDPDLEKYSVLGEAVRGASIANIPRNPMFSAFSLGFFPSNAIPNCSVALQLLLL